MSLALRIIGQLLVVSSCPDLRRPLPTVTFNQLLKTWTPFQGSQPGSGLYSTMPFFSLLRKSNQPSLARPASADVASDPFSANPDELPQRRRKTEPTPSLPRPWRRKAASTVTRASSSPPTGPALPVTPKVESPASDAAIREIPTPMPLPTGSGVFLTNLTMVPPTEMIQAISPVPDLLAATWDKVKEGPKGVSMDRSLDVLGALLPQIATGSQTGVMP